MFVRSLEVKFLKRNCVLNNKSYPSTFASFFGPIFLDYAVARWFFEGGFFIEVGRLDGSYLDIFFCIHPMMSSFCLRPLQFSWRILRCVVLSGKTLPCLCCYCLAPREALTVEIVAPLLYGQ